MDDLTHYMEATSRLRAQNEELREALRQAEQRAAAADADWQACMGCLANAKAENEELQRDEEHALDAAYEAFRNRIP